MLGRAFTLRRNLLALIIVAVAATVVPVVHGAGGGTAALRAQASSLASQHRSAILDLYALDHRLSSARSTLASLEQRDHALAAQRATLTIALRVARQSARIAQRRLAERLQLLYEQGEVSSLDVFLGNGTLDDALSRYDGLQSIAALDRSVTRQVIGARVMLKRAASTLAERSAALAAATRAAAETAGALASARAARASFVAGLETRQQLTARQIATVVSRARQAELRSAALTQQQQQAPTLEAAPFAPAAQPVARAPVPAAVGAGTSMVVSATAYSLPGHTASGLPVGWGVAAVDPRVIPLGTRFTVPGYGEAIAADVGTAIIGAKIDLWFPTFAQAAAWGRQTVTIVIH